MLVLSQFAARLKPEFIVFVRLKFRAVLRLKVKVGWWMDRWLSSEIGFFFLSSQSCLFSLISVFLSVRLNFKNGFEVISGVSMVMMLWTAWKPNVINTCENATAACEWCAWPTDMRGTDCNDNADMTVLPSIKVHLRPMGMLLFSYVVDLMMAPYVDITNQQSYCNSTWEVFLKNLKPYRGPTGEKSVSGSVTSLGFIVRKPWMRNYIEVSG